MDFPLWEGPLPLPIMECSGITKSGLLIALRDTRLGLLMGQVKRNKEARIEKEKEGEGRKTERRRRRGEG